ncbi:hypothetical protein RND81_10G119700 [Saponaria officinalis]|uniref:GRF-type domain-containing protein n=1 Tax=Saponaria officinalis TaxID=3572 RepID=A0AAW1I1H9_SAPOF
MNARGSSSSSSTTWRSKVSKNIVCNHNLPAVIRTAKKGANSGKTFFGCPLWPDKPCGFFLLMEDSESTSDSIVKGMQYEDMESKFANKVSKLKMKIEKLEKKNMELKILANKHAKGEKVSLIGLILSWIFFALSKMIE